MFVRIADRIRGIRRIELSSDNFRQQHKAGKKRYRVSFSSRSARGLTRHLSPRSKPLEFEWNPAIGRKKMALFRGILLLEEGGEKKKKKKKMRVEGGGEDSIFRPLRRGLTGCNGEPLRWRDEAKYLLTYYERNHEKVTRAHSQPCYARKVKFTVD